MKRMTKSVGADKSHISDKFTPHPYLFWLCFLYRSGVSCLGCLLWPPPLPDPRCLSVTDAVLTHSPSFKSASEAHADRPTWNSSPHMPDPHSHVLLFSFLFHLYPLIYYVIYIFIFDCCYDLFAATYKQAPCQEYSEQAPLRKENISNSLAPPLDLTHNR